MNVGNIDIDISEQTVTLRMRHLVQGHPGCVLSKSEVRVLIGRLDAALKRAPAPIAGDEDLIG